MPKGDIKMKLIHNIINVIQSFVKISSKNMKWKYKLIYIALFCLLIYVGKWILYLFLSILVNMYYEIASLNLTNDSWLTFFGSVLGGLITMLGVIMTVKYERKRDERNKIEQAQPIIIIHNSKTDDEKKPGKEYACLSYFSNSQTKNTKKDDWITLQTPDVLIENIGHNVALEISLGCKILSFDTNMTKRLEKLYPGNIDRIGIFINFDKNELLKDMNYQKNKSDIERLTDSVTITMYNDKIVDYDLAASYDCTLALTYIDLYKNKYEQEYDSKLYVIRVKDGFSAFFVSYSVSQSIPSIQL